MSTKTKSKTATFSCGKSPNLELIIEPTDPTYNNRGVRIGSKPRTAVKFNNFTAVLEQDGDGTKVNGRKQPMAFDELVSALENHRRYGSSLWREDEKAKGIPLDELRTELATADLRRIKELLEEEEQGPNRAQAVSLIAAAALQRSPVGHAPARGPDPRPDSAGTHQPQIARDGSHGGREPENPAGVLPPEGEAFPEPLKPGEPLPDSAGTNQPLPPDDSGPEPVFASDAAEEKAKELGVDPRSVTGTGSDGAITVADVKKAGEGNDAGDVR